MSETNDMIRMVECSDEMEMDIWSAAYDAMKAKRDKVIVLLKTLRSDTIRSDKFLEHLYRHLIRRTIADYRRAEKASNWVMDHKASVLFDPVTNDVVTKF